jgi:hypothetical protein
MTRTEMQFLMHVADTVRDTYLVSMAMYCPTQSEFVDRTSFVKEEFARLKNIILASRKPSENSCFSETIG